MDRHAALEALYEDHADAVRAFAFRRIHPTAAEDVVSEVFVVAWRRIDDVPDNQLTWLLGIARKTLANQRRSVARQVALLERIAREPQQAAVENGATIDPAMLRALGALRPADREALLLIAWDGLTPAQAAEVLGLRASALSMRLARARTRLASHLAAADGPTDAPATSTRNQGVRDVS